MNSRAVVCVYLRTKSRLARCKYSHWEPLHQDGVYLCRYQCIKSSACQPRVKRSSPHIQAGFFTNHHALPVLFCSGIHTKVVCTHGREESSLLLGTTMTTKESEGKSGKADECSCDEAEPASLEATTRKGAVERRKPGGKRGSDLSSGANRIRHLSEKRRSSDLTRQMRESRAPMNSKEPSPEQDAYMESLLLYLTLTLSSVFVLSLIWMVPVVLSQ